MKGIFATVAVLLTLVGGVFARQAPGPYRLRPEDVLHIQIYNEPQVNIDVPIGIDGNITAPFVGIIRAQGRTVDELADDLYGKYQKVLRLKDPKVAITILRFRPLRASIGGAVAHPGTFEFRQGDTLYTLLGLGGGASQDNADLRRATLQHAGRPELYPVDLLAIQNGTDPGADEPLQDGDILKIPENRRNKILVQGLVQRPGFFVYHEPMRLADAISLAGGEVPTRSKFSQTRVLRELPGQPGHYMVILCNYVRFIRNGDFSQNIELQPGDIIYVPETDTPDLNRIGNFVNSYFIFTDVLNRGILGIHLR